MACYDISYHEEKDFICIYLFVVVYIYIDTYNIDTMNHHLYYTL